jgi:hypothetical protein
MQTPVRLQQMQLMMNQQIQQSPNTQNTLLRQQQLSQLYYSQLQQQQQQMNQARLLGNQTIVAPFLAQNNLSFQGMAGFPTAQLPILNNGQDIIDESLLNSESMDPKPLSDKENNMDTFVV